jgi:hypothetical protein
MRLHMKSCLWLTFMTVGLSAADIFFFGVYVADITMAFMGHML